MAWLLTSVGKVSYVIAFKPSLTNYPYSKIFFLEFLGDEYLELSRMVEWNLFAEWLTAKSCLLHRGKFPSLVLYWGLNKPL